MSEVLAEVYRGTIAESLHRGDLVVVDADGRIVFSKGEPSKITYWRSASKPFQAVPVVTSGAAVRFSFTQEEIAIMTSSHSGQEDHVRTVSSVLDKIGFQVGDLHCGTHLPFHEPTASSLLAAGRKPNELHCNCSGKHASMLTLCSHYGYPVEKYWELDHPVQKLIHREISAFSELPGAEIAIGVDGCGVPVYALPLYNMSLAYAKLVTGKGLDVARSTAAGIITRSMLAFPYMVAGDGRICTRLMTALKGRIIAKSGAEGVYCVGLPEEGLGIALKIEDGSSRAVGPIILSVLESIGVVTRDDISELSDLFAPVIKNFRDEVVGRIVSVV